MRPFPDPPDGWRKIAPVNTIGYPTLSAGYCNDLIDLAGDAVQAGVSVTGTFTQVNGIWQLIPESLLITD